MKRSAIIAGLVGVMLIPASLAVAQTEDTPVVKQLRTGNGDPSSCSNYLENGEPQLLRLQDGTRAQNGARWGDGPMSSEQAPFQRDGFGPGECDGDCDGDGPFGPFGPGAEEAPYGLNGDQDGDGYGPGEAGFGAGPLDGTGPIHDGPEDGTGNQFGPGAGGNANASPGGPASQNGSGPGGNR